ncbi:MAG: hypothetical protein GDA36_05615 [Rhodobacteraceae bacterium]|nr:hypothetical protein [Paracoccaceae bacterium]
MEDLTLDANVSETAKVVLLDQSHEKEQAVLDRKKRAALTPPYVGFDWSDYHRVELFV